MVLRVIHSALAKMRLPHLGFSEANLQAYRDLLELPHGLIVHCGPTGSGKTTTLYTALNHLNANDRNIHTIEDPVELRMAGLNQSQPNEEAGVGIATLLKSYLRQDCDVILVGEIRDAETAALAVQASLTGHLILATIHGNSALGATHRLAEMGITPFFVAQAVSGIVYQLLVRRLCLDCREEYVLGERIARSLALPPGTKAFRAKGCRTCRNLGYRGRMPIHEIVRLDEPLREAITSGARAGEIETLAQRAGMIPILKDGFQRCLEGATSVEEVLRVVRGVTGSK